MLENEVPSEKKPSDVKVRVLTAIPVALALTAILIYTPLIVVGAVIIAFTAIGCSEYKNMLANKELYLDSLLLIGSAVIIGIGAITGGLPGLTVGLIISLTAIFFQQLLFSPLKEISDLQKVGLATVGIFWISWSMNHFILIKALPEGTEMIFLLLFTIWSSDTFAYFGGRAFGQTKLAPSISPKKTIEGSLCGAIGSGIIGGLYCAFLISSVPWWIGGFVAVGIAVLGQMGDLVESKFKRLCDIKDSGTIFPGHGGVLDRVDGFLTTVPLFYYIMLWTL